MPSDREVLPRLNERGGGRHGNKWTLIWPDDEERHTVSVADGHGVPPESGYTMIPVIRGVDYVVDDAAIDRATGPIHAQWPGTSNAVALAIAEQVLRAAAGEQSEVAHAS